MKTVVSITPIAVQRDSRTLKIAASLGRAGYRSIVVETETSDGADGLPFEVRSLGRSSVVIRDGGGAREGSLEWLRRAVMRSPAGYEAARAVRYLYRFNLPLVRALPEADLYYLHAPYQFPATAWAARRHGAAIVYDAHDFYSVLDDRPSPFVRWVEGRCVREAAEVVTVSDGVAGLMEAEFGRRPVVVRNSQDTRLDTAPAQGLRARLGLPADAFVIVTTGNTKAGGTPDEAIRALARLPARVHLALVGAGYEAHAGVIREAGVADRVHLVPPVKPSEVIPFIRSADAFIILYTAIHADYEHALPNKFFHAVSAGLPMLYPRLQDIQALAERHGLGLPIDPTDATSIAGAVRTWLDDPASLAAARAQIEASRPELSWERDERIVLDVVRNALYKPSTS